MNISILALARSIHDVSPLFTKCSVFMVKSKIQNQFSTTFLNPIFLKVKHTTFKNFLSPVLMELETGKVYTSHIKSTSDTSFINCLFTGIKSSNSGVALQVETAKLELRSCRFEYCSNSEDASLGIVYGESMSNFTVSKCVVDNCFCSKGSFFNIQSIFLSMSQCHALNSAPSNSPATQSCTYAKGNNIVINYVNFTGNFAQKNGGALTVDCDDINTISNLYFRSCGGESVLDLFGFTDTTIAKNLIFEYCSSAKGIINSKGIWEIQKSIMYYCQGPPAATESGSISFIDGYFDTKYDNSGKISFYGCEFWRPPTGNRTDGFNFIVSAPDGIYEETKGPTLQTPVPDRTPEKGLNNNRHGNIAISSFVFLFIVVIVVVVAIFFLIRGRKTVSVAFRNEKMVKGVPDRVAIEAESSSDIEVGSDLRPLWEDSD